MFQDLFEQVPNGKPHIYRWFHIFENNELNNNSNGKFRVINSGETTEFF